MARATSWRPDILRLLKSSAFRLTLLYVLMFGASVAGLVFYIYHSTFDELEKQIKHSVNIQLADLGRKFILDGTGETVAAINHLINTDKQDSYLYLLINTQAEWKIVAGNLARWPGGSTTRRDWIRFNLREATPENPHPPQAIAINSSLPRGYILLVGHKLKSVETMRETMIRMLWWCGGITLLLGTLVGIFLTWVISKRLEIINDACTRVMQGELKHRIAVEGSGDEFDHLGRSFNEMLSRIEELIAGIKDISANVAHDLRTPLNRVRNRLEKLEQGSLDTIGNQAEIRAAIQDVDRLVATFNAILRISQAEAGAGIERFALFNLSAAIADVSDLYAPLAEEKGLKVTQEIEPDIELNGDRHLLSQAVANLLDNAIKYTPAGGMVSVHLQREAGGITLIIADTGAGIPKAYHDKVTEKFFRMESSRNAPGNGLGLSLVKAAFTLHNASMELSDNLPGLKITVHFPTVP